MCPERSDLPVSDRWRRDGDGDRYARERFGSARARSRDPRLVARLLRSLPGGAQVRSVLDVPCGAGRLRDSILAAGEPGTADRLWFGADVSEEMLGAIPGRGGDRVRADAAALPFPDDSFDLVVCCRLLHHLPEPSARQAVLRELVRVSRDLVVASYWDAASYHAWRRRTLGPLRRRRGPETRHAVPWTELAAELEAAGATPVGRAHSLRFVSQQAFFMARKRRAT